MQKGNTKLSHTIIITLVILVTIGIAIAATSPMFGTPNPGHDITQVSGINLLTVLQSGDDASAYTGMPLFANIRIATGKKIQFQYPSGAGAYDGSIRFERDGTSTGKLILDPGAINSPQSMVEIPNGKQFCLGGVCKAEWPHILTTTITDCTDAGSCTRSGSGLIVIGGGEYLDGYPTESRGMSFICPPEYKAIAGGVQCKPTNYNSSNISYVVHNINYGVQAGDTYNRDRWLVSCGQTWWDEAGGRLTDVKSSIRPSAIKKAYVTCMKVDDAN